jgi:hypothetical protein
MRKAIKIFVSCLLVFVSITSCKKSDDSATTSENASKFPYTTETVNQQQTDLTSECNTLSTGIQGMLNVNAFSVFENFINLTGGETSQSARLINLYLL